MNRPTTSTGLSPVVSTALLVVVVVALVSLLAFTLFTMQDGGSNAESVEATVDFTATTSGVEVNVVRNENAEEFIVQTPGGSEETLDSVGDTVTVNDGVGTYSVIGVLPDGTEEVIDTRRITEDTFGGVFTVDQDTDDKEADATVQEDFESTDNYSVTVVTDDYEEEESTTFLEPDDDDGQLLSNPAEREGHVLQSQGIGIGTVLDVGNTPSILDIADVSASPDAGQFTLGDPVHLHEITNLCKGDEVHLLDAETNEVIAQGEEIKFNSTECDQLRRVVQYEGNQPVGAKLINLWNQDVGYSVFEFNGDVPPPTRPAPEGDDIAVEVTVYEEQSDGTKGDTISGADVVLGDLDTKTTDSNGHVQYTVGAEDMTLFATANAPGFFSSQVPVDLSVTGLVSDETIQKEILLPPESDLSFNQPEDDSTPSSGSISAGSSRTIDVSGGSDGGGGSGGGGGIAISGGSGRGGSGGSTITESGSFYSGSSTSTTTTYSSPTISETQEEEEIVENLTQPEREFNTLQINEDLIPSGSVGEFLVRTNVLVPPQEDSEVEETVIVKAIRESDGTEVNLEGVAGDTQNKTVFLDTGKTSVVDQKLHFPDGTQPGNYSIFVTINSSSKVLPAGSLEVFEGDVLDATISGAEVSPENPKVTKNGQTTVDITVDYDTHVTSATDEEITLDIFQNGKRIKTVENFGPGDVHTHQQTYQGDELGYYEYHVGVQESQEVALADSVLVSPESPSDINLNANMQVIGSSDSVDCSTGTQVADQFDCEIYEGESVDISGEIDVTGADISEFEDAEIILNWKEAPEGEERIYHEQQREEDNETIIDWTDPTQHEATNFDNNIVEFTSEGTVKFEKTDITYNNPEAYIIEARIRGNDSNGNQIGGQTDQTLNVAYDSDELTTQVTSSEAYNDDTARLVLESQRSSYEEEVRIDYVDNDGNVHNSQEVKVPRDGGELELFESFVLADYQGDNADVGDPVYVNAEIYKQGQDRSSNQPVDTAQIQFETQSEIGIDSDIDIIVE